MSGGEGRGRGGGGMYVSLCGLCVDGNNHYVILGRIDVRLKAYRAYSCMGMSECNNCTYVIAYA